MVSDGVNPLTNLGDVILVRAGVDTLGATIGAVAVILWTYRRRLPRALDAVTTPALVGLAGWHAGCLARGSCNANGQPVELYAAAGMLVVAAVTWWWWRRGAAAGAVVAGGLAGASAVRLVTEPLRYHLGSGQLALYAVGVGVGILGILVAEVVERTRPTKPETDERRNELGDGQDEADEHDGDDGRKP